MVSIFPDGDASRCVRSICALVTVLAGAVLPGMGPVRAADLTITPSRQDSIAIHLISDTQFPVMCNATPCSTIFANCVEHMNSRGTPDLTLHCGDLGMTSEGTETVARFRSIWDGIAGEKHWALGNHEADPDPGPHTWMESGDHYYPACGEEPLFRHGQPDHRHWFSILVGSPPRVAVFALNNNSERAVDDETFYVYCHPPNDRLNHAASAQRVWLNAEIDAMPASVELVIVTLHRTYYGVEDYALRPNVYASGTDGGGPGAAPAETLRTGAVSLLRDLESIPSRTGAERVIVVSGDQHCFAATHPIRQNVRDDPQGIPFLTIGGGGARIDRSTVFPMLSAVPPGVLMHAFDDEHFWTEMITSSDAATFRVWEAYADTLLFETTWPLDGAVGVPVAEEPAFRSSPFLVRPNPARSFVAIDFRPPPAMAGRDLDRLEILDVRGRRVIDLPAGGWSGGSFQRTWDLRDAAGLPVASGVYFVRAVAGGHESRGRITLIR